ncbi:MAG: P-loop NTPase [Pseudomonadota bacterium]
MSKPVSELWNHAESADHSAEGAVERPGDREPGRMSWRIPEAPDDERGDADEISTLAALSALNEPSEENTGVSLDIERYARGIWSRRWIVVLCAAFVTLVFGVSAFLLFDRTWIAHATLVKRAYQDEFQVGRFGKPFKPQNYNLKTLLDTLLLPSALDEAASRAGVAVSSRSFASRIDVRKDKDSQIFDITVQWDDPAVAARLVNRLAEVFIERNRDIRRSDAEETLLYYQGRQQSSERQSNAINSELQSFQDRYSISDIDTQLEVLVMELQRVKVERDGLEALVRATEGDLNRIKDAIKVEPEMIVQSSYFRNPLQANLTQLQWELEQARSRYTDKNPKVVDLMERIRKIEALVDSGADESSKSNTYAHNPVRQELSITHYKVQRELNQAVAKRDALRDAQGSMQARLDTLSGKQKEYDQLKVKHEAALQLQRNLSHRVEEARIIMMRNEADFELIERARPPKEGESTGRKLLVVAGAVLGTLLGLCIALALEILDARVRTLRDLRRLAGEIFVAEMQHVGDEEEVVVDNKLPNEPVAVAFRRIVNNIESHHRGIPNAIAIASNKRRAGRSTIATNFAQVLGLKERRVVLLDADVSPKAGERPGMLFEVKPEKGLDDLMDGSAVLDEIVASTESDNVKLVTASGTPSPRGDQYVASLGGRVVQDALRELSNGCDQLVVDLPPFSEHETVFEAVVNLGQTILVVPSGEITREEVRGLLERLDALHVTVLGIVLNEVPYELMETEPLFNPATRSSVFESLKMRFGRSTEENAA